MNCFLDLWLVIREHHSSWWILCMGDYWWLLAQHMLLAPTWWPTFLFHSFLGETKTGEEWSSKIVPQKELCPITKGERYTSSGVYIMYLGEILAA